MKKLFLLIGVLLYYSACSRSQDIVYYDSFINQAKDTIDYLYYSAALGARDTIMYLPARRYNPSGDLTFNLMASDYGRPGAGANNFYGGNGSQTAFPFPFQDNDQRFRWNELQTSATSYNFYNLDAAINKMISIGGKLSFRVMTCDNGQMSFPSFIPSKATNQPDFNSELYLSSLEKFVAQMAAHLSSTGLIKGVYKIDIGGIGNWSEMHWFGLSVPVITSASVQRIVNAYTTNFPNTWLMITISGLTNNSSLGLASARILFNASNNLGPVGIRSDHLGDIGTNTFDMTASKYYATDFLPSIKLRYLTSPMAGELMNNLSSINSSNPYSDLSNEVNGWHLSQFSDNNYCRVQSSGASASQISASDNNIINANKIAGARIGIISVTLKGSNLTMLWQNSGNAPVYEKWDLYINGVKSSFDLRTLVPNSLSYTIWTETISGSAVSIILKDPSGVRKPYPLQNAGRLADGSYKLF